MDANQIITFTLTAAEFSVVLTLTGKGPYEVVAPIITKLHQQVLAVDPTAFSPVPGLNGIEPPRSPPVENDGA